MSPAQQNIAIHQALGWRKVRSGSMAGYWRHQRHGYRADIDRDYTGDLNAMHAAVMTLDRVSRRVYVETLVNVCDGSVPGDLLGDQFVILNATAAQKAEAFLRVLNLWEGGAS